MVSLGGRIDCGGGGVGEFGGEVRWVVNPNNYHRCPLPCPEQLDCLYPYALQLLI